MKNLYQTFKQENPTLKALINDTSVNSDTRAQACLVFAGRAHEDASRLAIGSRAPYAAVKRSYYFYKAYNWYEKAESLFQESNNDALVRIARRNGQATFKASQVSSHKFL